MSGVCIHLYITETIFDKTDECDSCSQGAKYLKIDLAQLSSQKKFDFRNSLNFPSTTFLGTSYSQIVVAVFQEEPFCTPTPFLL